MQWHFTPYAVPLFVGAAAMAVIAVVSWRRRTVPAAYWMLLLSVATFIYITGYALELGSLTREDALVWLKIEYIGIVLQPVSVLSVVLAYTGYQRYQRWMQYLVLLLIPAITLGLAWTNEYHELIWDDLHLIPHGDHFRVDFTPGGWYYVNIAYIWVIAMSAMLWLTREVLKATGLRRRQMVTVLAGSAFPLLAHIAYLLDLTADLDVVPFGLTITGIVFAWGIFNFQMLDIVPVARKIVLDNMSDAVIVLDAQNRIMDLNPAAQRIIGRTADEVFGQSAEPLLGAWFAMPVQLEMEDIRTEITLGEGEAQRHYDLRLSCLFGPRQRVDGCLIVLRDITTRRRVQQERERLFAELDAFAHTVAHDLKNPLAGLVTYGLSVLEEADAEKADSLPTDWVREHVQIMVDLGQKSIDIVDALLLLASVEKQAITPEPLDMAAAVAQVKKRFAHHIAARGAQITVPAAWPFALGYGPWVEQVWANYLANALKYGGTPPVVELGASTTENGAVRFWVRDNGPGLTREECQRLFTPFGRLHKGGPEGYGLGLSIVQRIVETLGGAVGVESVPGQGSTFSFTLPAAAEEPSPQPQPLSSSPVHIPPEAET